MPWLHCIPIVFTQLGTLFGSKQCQSELSNILSTSGNCHTDQPQNLIIQSRTLLSAMKCSEEVSMHSVESTFTDHSVTCRVVWTDKLKDAYTSIHVNHQHKSVHMHTHTHTLHTSIYISPFKKAAGAFQAWMVNRALWPKLCLFVTHRPIIGISWQLKTNSYKWDILVHIEGKY